MYPENQIIAQASVSFQKGLSNFSSNEAILYLLNDNRLTLHLADSTHSQIFFVNLHEIKKIKKALSLLVIYLQDNSYYQINFDSNPKQTNVISQLGPIGLSVALFKTETSGVLWWYRMLKSKGVKCGGVVKQFIRALAITFISIFIVIIIIGIYTAFTTS